MPSLTFRGALINNTLSGHVLRELSAQRETGLSMPLSRRATTASQIPSADPDELHGHTVLSYLEIMITTTALGVRRQGGIAPAVAGDVHRHGVDPA